MTFATAITIVFHSPENNVTNKPTTSDSRNEPKIFVTTPLFCLRRNIVLSAQANFTINQGLKLTSISWCIESS